MDAGLAWLLTLAWDATNQGERTPSCPVRPAVQAAASLLTRGGDDRLSAIAAQVGISGIHLRRVFRRETGVAFPVFRNRCRLDRLAAILQRQPTRQLIIAALEAGFGSYPQFHRVCRTLAGCTPATFARRVSDAARVQGRSPIA